MELRQILDAAADRVAPVEEDSPTAVFGTGAVVVAYDVTVDAAGMVAPVCDFYGMYRLPVEHNDYTYDITCLAEMRSLSCSVLWRQSWQFLPHA